jgi:hypothetical protein
MFRDSLSEDMDGEHCSSPNSKAEGAPLDGDAILGCMIPDFW